MIKKASISSLDGLSRADSHSRAASHPRAASHSRAASHPRAASILYAIVITTVIIVTAGTMSASFIRASQRNHDLYRSTQAYYVARAAMEQGIADASANGGMGFESTGVLSTDFSPVTATGEYQVFSRSKWLGWQSGVGAPNGTCSLSSPAGCYVVPMPGTGEAGGEACEFTTPSALGQDWDDPTISGLDDDCNWNTIAYQETVSIPLYYEDPSCNDGICNPAEIQLNNFILRVRTPDGETLDGNDDVIVNWEISGDCDTDGNRATVEETCYMVGKATDQTGVTNSQIVATLALNDHAINDRDDVLVFNYPSQTPKATSNQVTLGDTKATWFMRAPDPPLAPYNTFEILNPTLKLSVISPLTTGFGATRIPNLEYQILTDTPISDNKIIYMAEGSAVGRLGTYVRNIRASQGLESNALINFVIQN